MPRAKKSDAATTQAASNESPAAVSTEKKPRKENQWNSYFKTEYPKYKGNEEHKSKSHSELTKIISAEYKKKKEEAPAAQASDQ